MIFRIYENLFQYNRILRFGKDKIYKIYEN